MRHVPARAAPRSPLRIFFIPVQVPVCAAASMSPGKTRVEQVFRSVIDGEAGADDHDDDRGNEK
jgi:hypothetical protein